MNQVLTFTKEDFDAAVRAKVEEALSDKEEIEARRVAEEALAEAQATFEQLRASIEAKDAKLAEYEEAISNLDSPSPSAAEVAANERIVVLEEEVNHFRHRAEVAEAALETIAKEETAGTRMAELEEAGVALEDEAAEAQYVKVRSMSDEEFAAYKSELVSLKAKYATDSPEEEMAELEVAELSADDVALIAQSLGCKPEEAECIRLVQEVAAKMAEVSKSKKMMKKGKMPPFMMKKDEEKATEETKTEEAPNQETASEKKLSLGEAISKATDQEIRPSAGMREMLAQAWDDRLKSKKEKSN